MPPCLVVPRVTPPPASCFPCSLLDWFLGYFLFIFLFFFAFLYFVDKIQGALLFNFKFAKMLEVGAAASRGSGWIAYTPASTGSRPAVLGAREHLPAGPPLVRLAAA